MFRRLCLFFKMIYKDISIPWNDVIKVMIVAVIAGIVVMGTIGATGRFLIYIFNMPHTGIEETLINECIAIGTGFYFLLFILIGLIKYFINKWKEVKRITS